MVGTLILSKFKHAALQTFQDGRTAWEELSRADPDLLITDMIRGGMNGWEMLPLLARRKVKIRKIRCSADKLSYHQAQSFYATWARKQDNDKRPWPPQLHPNPNSAFERSALQHAPLGRRPPAQPHALLPGWSWRQAAQSVIMDAQWLSHP
jgi:CheY-like chemotaxis protein